MPSDRRDSPRETRDMLIDLRARVVSLESRAKDWVTQQEFTPVRLIALGFAGLILTSAVLAVLRLVLSQ